MTEPLTVLVTGATGFVGRRLCPPSSSPATTSAR